MVIRALRRTTESENRPTRNEALMADALVVGGMPSSPPTYNSIPLNSLQQMHGLAMVLLTLATARLAFRRCRTEPSSTCTRSAAIFICVRLGA